MPIDEPRDQLYQSEVDFFAKYYEDHRYHPTGWRLRLKRELASLLREAGSRRLGRVLSLGCGDGKFELMLAPYAEQVVGLDLSPEAIVSANKSADALGVKNVSFRCLPLEDLEWSETYDVIVCLATLHHVPPAGIPDLLRTVLQHLAPGGLFYSQDPNRKGVLRFFGRALSPKFYSQYHTPDERELVPSELKAQMIEAGFQEVRYGYIDATLIPGLFVISRGPDWPMYLMLWFDWLWCHSPFAFWASGFFASARRKP